MRKRHMPAKLYIRLLGLLPGLPCSYTYHYLGRAKGVKGGYLDLGTDDDSKDNRKLRVTMSSVVLRSSTGKRHTYRVGWLPPEFGIPNVYWGCGMVR